MWASDLHDIEGNLAEKKVKHTHAKFHVAERQSNEPLLIDRLQCIAYNMLVRRTTARISSQARSCSHTDSVTHTYMVKEICVGDIVQKHVASAARDRPSIGTPVGNSGPSIAKTEFGVCKSVRMKPDGMLAWSSPGFGNPRLCHMTSWIPRAPRHVLLQILERVKQERTSTRIEPEYRHHLLSA